MLDFDVFIIRNIDRFLETFGEFSAIKLLQKRI